MSSKTIVRACALSFLIILMTLFCNGGFADEETEELSFLTARTRKHLSKTELKHLLRNNTSLLLDDLESLTDKQAQLLGTARLRYAE